jgi:hypothetical protein
MKQETEAERQRRELVDRQEALRLLEEQRSTAENILLNSAVDMREFIAMRKVLPERVGRPDLPRDEMTAADYCRVRKGDRDVLGRRIK